MSYNKAIKKEDEAMKESISLHGWALKQFVCKGVIEMEVYVK